MVNAPFTVIRNKVQIDSLRPINSHSSSDPADDREDEGPDEGGGGVLEMSSADHQGWKAAGRKNEAAEE